MTTNDDAAVSMPRVAFHLEATPREHPGTEPLHARRGSMRHLHHPRIRGGVLTGSLAIATMFLGAPVAQAGALCVVGPGVTQTDTTVTGSNGNDTIDCGGASTAKTIIGKAGN